MNFAQTLMASVADKNLLKHEVYEAWNKGTIPLETIQLYAKQYYHHVKAFPRYLSATHSNCDDIKARQLLLDNLLDEEQGPENHPELWLRFAEGIGASREDVKNAAQNNELMPEIRELVDTFLTHSRRSYAEGLGVLFAYEHQIPAIAKFKAEALEKHYSVKDKAALSFFEVHEKADVYHTQALCDLLEALSPEDKELCAKATRVASDQLWKFLDGIQKTLSV